MTEPCTAIGNRVCGSENLFTAAFVAGDVMSAGVTLREALMEVEYVVVVVVLVPGVDGVAPPAPVITLGLGFRLELATDDSPRSRSTRSTKDSLVLP